MLSITWGFTLYVPKTTRNIKPNAIKSLVGNVKIINTLLFIAMGALGIKPNAIKLLVGNKKTIINNNNTLQTVSITWVFTPHVSKTTRNKT